MKYEIKMKLRALSHSSDLFHKLYQRASIIKNVVNRGLSDERYIKKKYKSNMGKLLNLESPQTFNEKLQWLKLYDRNPLYTNLVDKYAVREYVTAKIGAGYLFPLFGVWDKFEDIDFQKLPKQFVLKCTHDCGSIIFCKDKRNLDLKKCKKELSSALKRNYYYASREWPYKNVPPKIIAEKYMVDESGYELKDYKFFCFNGTAKALFIATDRNNPNVETKFDFYDINFKHLPFTNGHPNADYPIEELENFHEMQRIAERLSSAIPQVRIDLYNIKGKVYFGEMTFFHWGGMMPFVPEEWDYTFGSWIDLSLVK